MSQLESALEWVKKFGHTDTGWAARVLAEELALRPKFVSFDMGRATAREGVFTVDPGQVMHVKMEFDQYVIELKSAVVVASPNGTAETRVDYLTGDPTPVITVTGTTLRSSE